MRLTSLTSSFFLMAEIFVKLGEQICAWCEGSLDTGVLALKLLLGALRAELLPCCLASSLAWAGVSSSTRALTLVLAWPLGGGWNKTNERRSLHHCTVLVMFICHEWASEGGRDFIWSKFAKLALKKKSTVSQFVNTGTWWLLCGLKAAEWWEACEQFNL